MNAAAKLSAYGAVLALAFGGAWVIGTAVGPLALDGAEAHVEHPGDGNAAGAGIHSGAVAGVTRTIPTGLASTGGEHIPSPTSTLITPGSAATRFDIEHRGAAHSTVDAVDQQNPAPFGAGGTGDLR
ncbi:hypothetical protein ABT324_10745 [Saccharopolyspora sp. NPDC000359]|uniref:hypothetical protein n=1 Tax=Saccharopolyspora sp. NPDC000359 TaxID=3154251 RepID=UPI00331793A5